MKVYIYILRDPASLEIKYVGKTVNPKIRLRDHIATARNGKKTYVYTWIRSLFKKGLLPIMTIEEICNELNWKDKEKYWIKYYKDNGKKLCNLTLGGEESITTIEARNRHSMSCKGIPKSEETKRKMKANHVGTTGYKVSEETKLKMKHTRELNKYSITFEQRLQRSIQSSGANNNNAKKCIYINTGKQYGCLKDACKELKLSYFTQYQRIRKKSKLVLFKFI